MNLAVQCVCMCACVRAYKSGTYWVTNSRILIRNVGKIKLKWKDVGQTAPESHWTSGTQERYITSDKFHIWFICFDEERRARLLFNPKQLFDMPLICLSWSYAFIAQSSPVESRWVVELESSINGLSTRTQTHTS